MKLEFTTEETVTTTRGGTATEAPKKKSADKGRFKEIAAKVGAVLGVVILVLIGLAVAAGIYFLLGWGLVAAIAFVSNGVLVLSALQGAVALVVLSFIGSLFR